MLKNIHINRFKSIRSQYVELGKVNIFIGGNGSGKSNVLEAIGLASAALGRGLDDSDLASRGIRLSAPELMKSAHKNIETPRTLELECGFNDKINYKFNLTSRVGDPNLRFHSESCSSSTGKQFGRGPNGATVLGRSMPALEKELEKHRGMWDQVKVAYDFDECVRESFRDFSKYVIYSPQTDFLRGVKQVNSISEPVGLHGEGLATAVKEIIKQIHEEFDLDNKKEWSKLARKCIKMAFLPNWTNAVRVEEIENKSLIPRGAGDPDSEMIYFIDKFMKSGRNKLTAYDSSEGTLFLLFVAVLLSHHKAPKYFALDNVDNALNPRLTRRLLEEMIDVAKSKLSSEHGVGPKQIFLTSHNPTSLDAFDIFDNDQRIFVVKRNQKGHTEIERLQPGPEVTKQEWNKIVNGKNLSQLWLDDLIPGANGLYEDI